ncbi:MAG TPA: alpha/beta hydrolase [Chitinophagaceae bacterium]|nr:alpha/beta hydrolase [Chitinophagaceae bacterium]
MSILQIYDMQVTGNRLQVAAHKFFCNLNLQSATCYLQPANSNFALMKAYLIPGLAADKRVFRHIHLPDGFDAHYIEWIKPEHKESLAAYALRLAGQIDTEQPYILIGLSFGGMLAVEIAKKFPPKQLILIATVPHHTHLPSYYKKAFALGVHKLASPGMIKNFVYFKRFFTSESREDKIIIKQMARDMDHAFIRWAVEAIMQWDAGAEEIDCFHIHGTHDEIFPHRYTRPSFSIPNAGHLMIFNRAADINSVLDRILREGIFAIHM